MKIKHTFTLFCLPFTLALFLVSCGTSGDGNGESFEASDVSAANCADAAALNCFISQWDTTKTADGASYTNTIVLPLVENGEYDFYVDWGDETAIENITEFDAIEVTHTYAEEGEYTIHIAGEIKGWRFFVSEADNEIANSVDDFGDAVKLLDVSQWGSLSLGNTDGRQFYAAANFNATASDAPDLSETTDLSYAFANASKFNAEIGNWDVSTVTNMEFMFFNAAAFDQDLSKWNVCKVTGTGWGSFDAGAAATWTAQEKPNWGMDCPGGDDGGDTGRFADVSEANCADVDAGLSCFISVWNTAHVPINKDITGFSGTMSVKLPLVEGGTYDFYVDWGDGKEVENIEAYDAPEVTHNYDESGTYTIHIAGTIKGWRFFTTGTDQGDAVKLLNVIQWGSLSLGNTAGGQFEGAENFNPTATDAPDLSETTDLIGAFFGASSFNADISDWDVSQVTTMKAMFLRASSFNNNGKPLDWGIKTSKVVDMKDMFNGASVFNQDISGWKVENVTSSDDFATDSGLELNNFPFKFRGANAVSKEVCEAKPELNCFISVWDTENSGDGTSATNTIVLPLVSEGTYNFHVNWGDESEVEYITNYSDATHTYSTPGEYIVHITGTIKGWRFYVDYPNLGDTVKLLNVTQWGSLSLGNTDGRQFQGAANFNPTATDAPDVSETTDLVSAFGNASSFNADISDWDVSKVIDMGYMFSNASSFNNNGKPLDWGDKTSKVTDMQSMFFGAGVFNQDISGWNVENVTTMKAMFRNAEAFNNKAAELKWGAKTSKVTDMIEMFNDAKAFNQDISGWNVENVTTMKGMFLNATSFNNNRKGLDWGAKTSKVTDMQSMFFGAGVFNQDISGWNVEKVEKYDNFATGSALITNHTPPKFRGANAVSKEVCAAKPELHCFISVWNTDQGPSDKAITGFSGTKMVKLPLVSKGTYDFYVNWGDESDVQKIISSDAANHEYKKSDEYTIYITGVIKGWSFFVEPENYGDAAKLLNVSQWGSLSLGNTAGSQFRGAEYFNPTATDAPNLSETTNLIGTFFDASSFNANISGWNVSKITNMFSMFRFANKFNNRGKPLEWGFKTGRVTNMENMFHGASDFNQDVSRWNVANVMHFQNFATGSRIENKPNFLPKFKQ